MTKVENASHVAANPLHLVQNLLLELPLDLLALLICVRFAVEVKESAEVELGGLQELNFADVDLLLSVYAALEGMQYETHIL